MASLYFSQSRTMGGLTTSCLHVYRSAYDAAARIVVKTHLGAVPKSTRHVPPALAAKLNEQELIEVEDKVGAARDELVSQILAATECAMASSLGPDQLALRSIVRALEALR